MTVLPSSCKSVGSSCGTWPVCGCRAFSTAPRAQGAASSASEAHGEELGQKASMWEPWLRFKPQPQPMRAPRSSRQREGPGQGDRRPWPLPPSPRNSARPVSSANPDKCLSIKWKRRFPARTRRGPGGRCPAAPPLLWRMQMVLGHRLGNISAGASTRHTSSSAGLCCVQRRAVRVGPLFVTFIVPRIALCI